MSSTYKPPVKQELQNEYERLHPLYQRLCEEVVFILDDEIRKLQIKVHDTIHRVKSFESLYDKILRKEISGDPFSQVSDVAGVRVICLYRSGLDALGKLIEENFNVVRSDTSRTRMETQFGYMADHYIVKLSGELRGKRYDEIKPLQCEIQVRTILMDAWASVSHHLDYKMETDIPSELKKDFNAVSGLLYAADTHFELFKKGIEESKTKLSESVKSDRFDLKQEINLDSLRTYLNWKFPDREKYAAAYSDLVKSLKDFGYIKVIQLDKAIEASEHAAASLEKEELRKIYYTDTGFTRICLMLYDEHFYEAMRQTHQKKNMEFFELIDKYRLTIRRN